MFLKINVFHRKDEESEKFIENIFTIFDKNIIKAR